MRCLDKFAYYTWEVRKPVALLRHSQAFGWQINAGGNSAWKTALDYGPLIESTMTSGHASIVRLSVRMARKVFPDIMVDDGVYGSRASYEFREKRKLNRLLAASAKEIIETVNDFPPKPQVL